MQIDDRELDALERLAALQLDPGERERLRDPLRRLREWIACLESTPPLDPTADDAAADPVTWREDVAGPPLDVEVALGSAPARRGDFLEVPGVAGLGE